MTIGFEVGPDLVRRPQGKMEPTTWGAIELGHIVQDQKGHLHTVIDDSSESTVTLRSAHPAKDVVMRRPAADRAVNIYVPSEEEALQLLSDILGTRVLLEIEEREHSIARALTMRLEPVPNKANFLQNHLDMLHGINVDDVLRKHRGTEANPASKKTRADTLAELRNLHDEAHADPDLWPMSYAHVHTLDPKENR